MMTPEQMWKMSEPDKVVAIIKELELWRLGNWDGCCCSSFSIRGVDIDIACGKGRRQGVWVSSQTGDYQTMGFDYGDPDLLRPIMKEVVRQLEEQSGRGGKFAEHFRPWNKNDDR